MRADVDWLLPFAFLLLPWYLSASLGSDKMVRIIIAITIFTALALVSVSAVAQRSTLGPVVSAYLTNLGEELKELDFQLRHREISRQDYDRSYQRLTILRRVVEHLAAERQEDRVPELEVLVADEFDRLGLSTKPEADALRVGELLDERWKLLSTERITTRFFVFEKLNSHPIASNAEQSSKSKPRSTPNPQDAIETVIVYENVPKKAPTPTPQPTPTPVVETALPTPRNEPPPVKSPTPANNGPRILSFYLPIYTPEARKRSIEGDLVVSALFQRNGKIKDVVVEHGLGFGLDERAIDAVKKILFEAAQRDGQPMDSRAQIVFTFKQGRVTVRMLAGKSQ